MEVKIKTLAEELREAEEDPFEAGAVSDYVMEHIFEPLRRGERLFFKDVDFSRFSQEDIGDLYNYIDRRDAYYSSLCNLNAIFCRATPVSVKARAFC
ncbi:MAG: hypothetical protein IJV64_04690 [Oscillospiraceae bacterium]|nr:hypothetical protein [Oscillospiraceae bacterium]